VGRSRRVSPSKSGHVRYGPDSLKEPWASCLIAASNSDLLIGPSSSAADDAKRSSQQEKHVGVFATRCRPDSQPNDFSLHQVRATISHLVYLALLVHALVLSTLTLAAWIIGHHSRSPPFASCRGFRRQSDRLGGICSPRFSSLPAHRQVVSPHHTAGV